MADNDDDFADSVANMADRLGLKGKERSTYIHEHMTRGGYKMVPNYVPDEGDDDDDDGDNRSPFFRGGRGRPRGSRSRGNRRSRDDDDW